MVEDGRARLARVNTHSSTVVILKVVAANADRVALSRGLLASRSRTLISIGGRAAEWIARRAVVLWQRWCQ